MSQHQTLITKLKSERSELYIQLSALDKAIQELEPTINIRGWKDRTLECLKMKGVFSRTVDILECVLDQDKESLNNPILRKRLIANVSAALNTLCCDNKIVKHSIYKFKGDVYGLPEWNDSNGNPRGKYLTYAVKKMI